VFSPELVKRIRDTQSKNLGRRALALGASDFLTKPVNLAHLDRSLQTALAGRPS
jgi:CheY-like chemotaxis protein